MRKWILLAVLLVLLGCVVPAALAAPTGAAITDAAVEPGETVYLTVSLEGSHVGDSIGISFTYDSDILTPLYSSCTWADQGMLQDFGAHKNAGVWAVAEPVELEGEICTLAFTVRSGAAHFQTAVSCAVIVKNGSEDLGSYTAHATVTMTCDHDFDSWKDAGGLGHSRSCAVCGLQQNQTHSYDDGVTTTHPDTQDLELTTYTCTRCGAVWEVQHAPDKEPEQPTLPVATMPPEVYPTVPTEPRPAETQPVTSPAATATAPTEPSDSENVPTQATPSDTTDSAGTAPTQEKPGQDNGTLPTEDDHDHDHGTLPAEDEHDHDHTVDPDSFVSAAERTRNIIVFLATLALLGIAARVFLQKKRR